MTNIIEVLEHAAVEAGQIIRLSQGLKMDILEKEEQLGAHFSTRADRESQERALYILRLNMPDEIIIAEESKHPDSVPENCTVLDPLDGTTIFFNGHNEYSVSICTLREGQPTYAATYFPAQDWLISAVRGHGCYLGGFEAKRSFPLITWHGNMDKTLIETNNGPWSNKHNTIDTVYKPLIDKFCITSTNSATEGGRRVLCELVGAYYNFGIAKIWDAAAMTLAITEAGGVACDPYGRLLRWDKIDMDWIVAANQQLADEVIRHSKHWTGRK